MNLINVREQMTILTLGQEVESLPKVITKLEDLIQTFSFSGNNFGTSVYDLMAYKMILIIILCYICPETQLFVVEHK